MPKSSIFIILAVIIFIILTILSMGSTIPIAVIVFIGYHLRHLLKDLFK